MAIRRKVFSSHFPSSRVLRHICCCIPGAELFPQVEAALSAVEGEVYKVTRICNKHYDTQETDQQIRIKPTKGGKQAVTDHQQIQS